MNAQEAIERMEARLQTLKEKSIMFEGISYKLEHERINEEIEALSIVLESAKLLHEVTMISPVYGGEFHMVEVEDCWLLSSQLDSLGLHYEVLEDE